MRYWFLRHTGILVLLYCGMAHADLDFNAVCLQPGMNVDVLECNALVNFYNITDGDQWTNNSNWGTADVNSWFGLTVDVVGGHVLFMQLPNNNLNGFITATIDDLTELRILNLESNGLFSNIPTQIGSLDQLGLLLLGNNQLTGDVPASFSNLNSLNILQLQNNNLSGSVLDKVTALSDLTDLWIDNNDFVEQIPDSIGQLQALEYFSAVNVGLQGHIPASIGDLSQLEFLILNDNDLSGVLTPCLGSLLNLQQLAVQNNSLSGRIPSTVGDMSALQLINLGFNRLSGPMPDSLGTLNNLDTLFLNQNRLTGSIPLSFSNLDLDFFFVSANNLDFDSNSAQQPALIPAALQSWFAAIPNSNVNLQSLSDEIFYSGFDENTGCIL